MTAPRLDKLPRAVKSGGVAERSPDRAKRNPGTIDRLPRVSLRFTRATCYLNASRRGHLCFHDSVPIFFDRLGLIAKTPGKAGLAAVAGTEVEAAAGHRKSQEKEQKALSAKGFSISRCDRTMSFHRLVATGKTGVMSHVYRALGRERVLLVAPLELHSVAREVSKAGSGNRSRLLLERA